MFWFAARSSLASAICSRAAPPRQLHAGSRGWQICRWAAGWTCVGRRDPSIRLSRPLCSLVIARRVGLDRRASLNWHVDETNIRVGGRWRYLWRAIDADGQMVDFRLTARRDAKAARAFLRKAIERVRLHRPVSICTDKAHAYRSVICELNHRYDPHFDSIQHIDRKWRNNRIESDHAALKRLLGYRQSFDLYDQQRQLSAAWRPSGQSNADMFTTRVRASAARSSLSKRSSNPQPNRKPEAESNLGKANNATVP